MRISKSEIKLLRSLGQKKVREREKKFVIEGWKSLRDALNSDFHIELVAMKHKFAANPDYGSFVRDVESRRIDLKELSDIELNQVADTIHSQGVVAIVRQKIRTLDDVASNESKLIVVADRVADPGNLGTIVRTCDWFGVDGLILSTGCVDLYNEKVVRSTSGSIFHLPVFENADAKAVLSQMKKRDFRIIATAGDVTTSYADVNYEEKNVIVFGNEAAGVQSDIRRLADAVVCIPRQGKAESLNVGVACGIVLSHLRNQG